MQNLLDNDALAALTNVMGAAEVESLLTLFVEDSKSHMQAIADGVATGMHATVVKSAHVLVSSAGSMGAVAMSDIARKLEEAARGGHVNQVAELAERLRDTHQRTLAALPRRADLEQAVA